MQRKRRFRRGGPNLTFSILRKELREGNGSSFHASSNSEPNPLLSSFIYKPSAADQSMSTQPQLLVEMSSVAETLEEELVERYLL